MYLKLLKSRTVWLSIVLAMLSVAQGFVLKLPMEPMEQMYVGMAIAAAIVVLRILTTQPISEK